MYKIETIYQDGQFNLTRTHEWMRAVQYFCNCLEDSTVAECKIFDSQDTLILSYTKPKEIHS